MRKLDPRPSGPPRRLQLCAAGERHCRGGRGHEQRSVAAPTRILLVDDEPSLREPLADYLTRQGFAVTAAASAAEARTMLLNKTPDLVLLDIMMPGEDGLSLCRHLIETKDLPVILLTARGEAMDRIVGLEIGADDYVREAVRAARAGRPDQERAAPCVQAGSAAAGRRALRIRRLAARSGQAPPDRPRRRGGGDFLGRIPPAGRLPRPSAPGDGPRPAARHGPGPRGASVRPRGRQPGQPPAPQDRRRRARTRS